MSKILSLANYDTVKAINGVPAQIAVNDVLESFQNASMDEMFRHYASSMKAGAFYILTSVKHPGKIVEHVSGLTGDSISALYEPHPIFNSPGDLLKAREDLIEMIESSENASPGKLRIRDEGGGRAVFLQEPATAQLIDLVQRAMMKRGMPAAA